jgi:hypothetical protein
MWVDGNWQQMERVFQMALSKHGITDRMLVKAALAVIYSDDLLWSEKYEIIFSKMFSGKIVKRGIVADWYDPDMDYEDDVRAFASVLQEWLDNKDSM